VGTVVVHDPVGAILLFSRGQNSILSHGIIKILEPLAK
jgi:hypothetical protein